MKLIVNTLVLAITLSLAGCDKTPDTKQTVGTNDSATSTTTPAPSNPNATKYIMAVEAIYAPFAFKDEKGQVIGFDADIIRAIGKKQGFEVEVISQPWTGIFDTLDKGTRDIVGSGVVSTPERAEKMELSEPILQSRKTAVYLGTRTDIKNFDSLKTLKVGVQADTAYEKALRAYMGENSPSIITYDSSFIPVQDVVKGKIDAAFNNSNINEYYINTISEKYNVNNLKTIEIPNTPPDDIVFAVKKGRTDLLQKINTGLAQIKQDGTYAQIYKKWFGNTASNSVTASASNMTESATTTTK